MSGQKWKEVFGNNAQKSPQIDHGEYYRLQEENVRLRKALEFYADRESWAFHATEYDVHDDRGMTAREALK